jgi:hypothetical protein
MSRSIKRLFQLVVLASVAGAVFASPALAQPAHAPRSFLPAKLPPAPAGFRASYERMLVQLEQIGRGNGALNRQFNLSGAAAQSLQATQRLTPAQLAAVYYAVSYIPHWQNLPSIVRTAQLSSDAANHSRLQKTGDGCPADVSDAALTTANSFKEATDFALEILPDSEVGGGGVIAAGEGAVVVVTSPASPLRIPVKGATIAADVAVFQLQLQKGDHDSCVQDQHVALLDKVAADLATDTQNIRNDLSTDTQTIRNDLATDTQNIRSDLSTDTQTIRNDLATDTQTILTNLANDFNQLTAQIAGLSNQVSTVQTTLNTRIEQRQVHVDVLSLTNGRLLLSLTESGQPINATLVSLKYALNSPGTLSFTDATAGVTAIPVGTGLLQINFPSPPGSGQTQPSTTQAATVIYQVVVKDDGSTGVIHYGTDVFGR